MSTDLRFLADAIQARDFDHPFRVVDGAVVDAPGHYAPAVYHDETTDVFIDDERWRCLRGLTGQYGYSGAVLHASEYVSEGVATVILDVVTACDDVVFALVVVMGLLGEDSEGSDYEPAGWAIAYRELPT